MHSCNCSTLTSPQDLNAQLAKETLKSSFVTVQAWHTGKTCVHPCRFLQVPQHHNPDMADKYTFYSMCYCSVSVSEVGALWSRQVLGGRVHILPNNA